MKDRFIDWLDRHGEVIRSAVAREMPGESGHAVEMMAEAVVVRALFGVGDRPALDDPATPAWLEELAAGVCHEVRQLEVRPWEHDPKAVREAALRHQYEEFRRMEADYPTGLPWLDRYIERMREKFGLAVLALALLARRLRDTIENGTRAVHDRIAFQMAALGEVQALLPATAPAARNAAAAVGAALSLVIPPAFAAPLETAALGTAEQQRPIAAVGGPAVRDQAALPPTGVEPTDTQPIGTDDGAASPAPTATHTATAPGVETEGKDGTLSGVPEPTSTPAPLPPPPPQPRGEVRPPEDEPVGSEDHQGVTYYGSLPVEPVELDADGDGDNELSAGSPYAGWDCVPPDERGTASAVACPAFEESGVLDEQPESAG